MTNEYQGKVVVITGGARGFGRAFGQALAEQGAQVALIDRDGDAVAATAVEITATADGRCTAYQGDVTDEAGMKAIMATVAEAGQERIDVLINNAGLHSHEYSRPIAEMGLDKTRRLFEVNVIGTVNCTLAAQPYMASGEDRASRQASIVNIASAAAFQGGAYGNSKLAVIGLTMTFARELASDNIRVNAIAPGLILTDTIRDEMVPATLDRIKTMQYLSQSGEERDIVEAMLFLASERARFITGETLRVTGGFAAGI